jgi:hypothetical protein
MNHDLESLVLSVILIILGVLLKKELIPNTKKVGKLWLLLIVTGSLNIILFFCF